MKALGGGLIWGTRLLQWSRILKNLFLHILANFPLSFCMTMSNTKFLPRCQQHSNPIKQCGVQKCSEQLSNFARAHISPPGRSIFCPTSSGLKRWDSARSPLSSLGNEWEMLCEKRVIWERIRCSIWAPWPPPPSLCLDPVSLHKPVSYKSIRSLQACTIFFLSGMVEISVTTQTHNKPKMKSFFNIL